MVACATWNNAPSQRPVLEHHCRVKSLHGIHEAQDGALAEVITGTRAIRGDGADGHVVQVASRDLEEHITPHAAAILVCALGWVAVGDAFAGDGHAPARSVGL